jgi:hypothetical protein
MVMAIKQREGETGDDFQSRLKRAVILLEAAQAIFDDKPKIIGDRMYRAGQLSAVNALRKMAEE